MNTVLRTLFVWLLLLALPFQGVAAARMLPSVHAAQAASAATNCHGRHMTAAAHGDEAAAGDHHENKHHGACADCCIAVAPVPAPRVPPACAPPSWAIPFHAGHVPSVDPVLPDRPPRLLVA